MPHRHDNSSELFYILDGAFDLLVDDNVVTARTGDLLVVPPGSAHAFAAHHDSTAEALIIATPGIERFDYFRHVVRRREGSEPPEAAARAAGPLRHPLPRQSRLAARPRGRAAPRWEDGANEHLVKSAV